MLKSVLVIFLLVYILSGSNALANNTNEEDIERIEKSGDFFAIALPVIAGISTFFTGNPEGGMWDREGTKQAVFSIGTTFLATQLIKLSVDKLRPNESNTNSFPSGHTSTAFSGAAFIGERYGWRWGLPAYMAATFVGYSRVHSNWHFADDVVAGASIAILSAWYWVTPQSGSVKVSPAMMEDGVGINVKIGGDEGFSIDIEEDDFLSRSQYRFLFGPAYLRKNHVSSPSKTGSVIRLEDFNKVNNPVTTARIEFQHSLGSSGDLLLAYNPFESRDTGTFSDTINFAGQVFPSATTIESSWRNNMLHFAWRYNILNTKLLNLRFRLGIVLQHLSVQFRTADKKIDSQVQDMVILPVLYTGIHFKITPRLKVLFEADGIYLTRDQGVAAGLFAGYKLDKHWELLGGYQFYKQNIYTVELGNEVEYDLFQLAIGYSWR